MIGFSEPYLHYNWHWFYDWGTGEAGNNGVHFLDILRWGMALTYPTHVNSSGGRYVYNDDWQFPDTQVVNLEYGDNKLITWEGRSCNGRNIEDSSVGCAFYGETGTLVIGGGNAYKIYDLKNKLEKDMTSEMSFKAGDTMNPTAQLDSFHFSNLLDGIRKGASLNADINVGCISTTPGSTHKKIENVIVINNLTGCLLITYLAS